LRRWRSAVMFVGLPVLSLRCRKLLWANLPGKYRETHKTDRCSSRPRDLNLFGGKMIVLSRSCAAMAASRCTPRQPGNGVRPRMRSPKCWAWRSPSMPARPSSIPPVRSTRSTLPPKSSPAPELIFSFQPHAVRCRTPMFSTVRNR